MSANHYMNVAIVIVTWNSAHIISDTLDSLRTQEYPQEYIQTVVVDNNSQDGTPALINSRFPWVKVLAERKNHGFARGNNIAMRAFPAEVFALVNPDVTLHPMWLRSVIQVLQEAPTVGVVASKLFYSNRILLQHAGGVVEENAITRHRGDREFDIGQYNTPRDVDYAMGAALVTRADLAQSLDYLPEAYFMYYEEADYCLRARRRGYAVRYCPQAIAYHDEKHSLSGKPSRRFLELYHRSRYLYALRNFTSKEDRKRFRTAELAWRTVYVRDGWSRQMLLRSKLSHARRLIRDPWLLGV